ncbi:hypothetical protein BTR23_20340 [Alkalihalophilus pseudofirmus]|nr:hypothetical protein BTR23_20340 [Alkalihalophilus pseudofirmus]
MLNQKETPLYSMVINHARKKPHSFHVPGHKWGSVLPEFAKEKYEAILEIDGTELTDLDDLHDAQTIIKEAQQLLANVYGAKASYFLIGGSTVGNIAMLLSVCSSNDIILVQRDSHKSVMNGIQLAQAKPIYLTPEYDEETGLSMGVRLDTVILALKTYPNANALFLTNPSYYGVTNDLSEIIEFTHKYNVPVLVDEAHGAHFGIGKGIPPSAISQGADIVVQSAHKTLPAMTMGSYLHFNSSSIPKKKVEHYLQMLQSSSPSYPIMASLDLARHYVANLKESELLKIVESSKKFKCLLKEIPQLTVFEVNELTNYKLDPLKITVRTNCELTGVEIQMLLEEKGIFVELANEEYLLLILPLLPFTQGKHITSIIKKVLKPFPPVRKKYIEKKLFMQKISSLYLSKEEMETYSTTVIPLEQAVSHIIAEHVIPYPPGVPLLIPGEIITSEVITTIVNLNDVGARFQGHPNITETGIKVFIIDERKEDEE